MVIIPRAHAKHKCRRGMELRAAMPANGRIFFMVMEGWTGSMAFCSRKSEAKYQDFNPPIRLRLAVTNYAACLSHSKPAVTASPNL
jgi:hypothetical protein